MTHYLNLALEFNIRSMIKNLCQLRSKVQFLSKFYREISKVQIEEGLSFEDAYKKIDDCLLKLGYNYKKRKQFTLKKSLFYDDYPFECNVVSFLPGQSRNFEILFYQAPKLQEFEEMIHLI
jgi:hypothetical protein